MMKTAFNIILAASAVMAVPNQLVKPIDTGEFEINITTTAEAGDINLQFVEVEDPPIFVTNSGESC